MNKRLQKLKEIAMKDFGWKLLSLVIAIALWFIVLNIQNPVETRNFSTDLTMNNLQLLEENGLVITNREELENTKISVRVRAQRLTLDRIYQNRDDIEAYIDFGTLQLEEIVGKETSVAVQIRLPAGSSNSEIELRSPSNVTVLVEYAGSKEVPVEVTTAGEETPQSAYAQPEMTPSAVTVTGPESKITQVVAAKGTITADPLTDDTTYTVTLQAVDASGNVVEGVTLSQDECQVYIPPKQSKRVPLVAEAAGVPADGYVIGEVTCTPSWVYIIGDEEALSTIDEIRLPSVSVEGRDDTVNSNYAISYLLPAGVSLKENEPDRATITVEIEEEARKTIALDAESLSYTVHLEEGLKTEVVSGSVVFEISGAEDVLANITGADISGSVDVTDLQAGEYSLPVDLTLPDGVRLVNNERPYVTVVISSDTQEDDNLTEEEPQTEPEETVVEEE